MSNKIFVDTNVIIDLFEKKNLNNCAIKLQSFLGESSVDLYINNFVIAEVLQGIKIAEINKYKKFVNLMKSSFNIIEVNNEIIMESIEIYRLCKANGTNFNNEFICKVSNCNKIIYNSIDCIHYATCEAFDLKLLATDKVFTRIDEYRNNDIVLNLIHN